MVYPMVKRRLFWLSLMLLALGAIFLAPVLGLVPVRFARPGEPAIPPVPAPVLTPQGSPPSVSAASAFLLDADSGNTLADINGEQERTMASTTKIMTALVALQRGQLDQLITVHEDAIQEVEQNDGSNASLKVNEQLTLRDLLYALLLPSGDDAPELTDSLSAGTDLLAAAGRVAGIGRASRAIVRPRREGVSGNRQKGGGHHYKLFHQDLPCRRSSRAARE